jgi:hypothetical protein
VGLVAVGFSQVDRLEAIERRVGWKGLVLSDPERVLYRRLGLGRAPWWRVYTPGTLAAYAGAVWRRESLHRPVEDTRQLGGDAIMVNGVVVALWRPTSPDDRPPAPDVLRAATSFQSR